MQNTSSHSENSISAIDAALGEVRIELLGFAFHPAWIYLLFYGSGALGEILGHTGDAHEAAYFLSMAPLALMTLVGVIATKRFMKIATRTALVVGAPVATALGTLLYVADAAVPGAFYLVGGGVLTGVGSAFLAARWAALFGRFPARTLVANLPLLLFLQVALCLSISYLSDHLQVALLVGLPLASGMCLWWAERRAAASVMLHGAKNQREGNIPPLRRALGLLLAFVAIIGLSSALLGSFGRVDDRFDYGAWLDIAVALLVLLFVGRALLVTNRRTFPWLFAAPTAALLFILLPPMRFSTDFFADVVYPIGTIVFELLLLFASTLLARTMHRSPAKVFMAARFVYALSDIAGSAVGDTALSHFDALTIAHGATVTLMGTVGLLFTTALLLAVGRSAHHDNPLSFAEAPKSTAAANESETATAQPRGTTSTDEAQDPKTADESLTPHEVIAVRCQQLGEQFALSEREREVLVLIAEGRSSARIQEDLSIAAGTVNYHTRNIYAKLGVHSRQEIIDMTLGIGEIEKSGVDS